VQHAAEPDLLHEAVTDLVKFAVVRVLLAGMRSGFRISLMTTCAQRAAGAAFVTIHPSTHP
jgi:hypothetical protein